VPPSSTAYLMLDMYDHCNGANQNLEPLDFSGDVQLIFTAQTTGEYYFYFRNILSTEYGAQVAYELSARPLPVSANGAVVLVAGKWLRDDPLQANIYTVTDRLYKLALANGCTDDDIFYLAPEKRLGVDDIVSADTLQTTITQWASQHAGPDKRLTFYLMDHAQPDKFYLNGVENTLNSTSLDTWLTQLETTVPGIEINGIIESCYAGSFIDGQNGGISRNNRLIMTSASANNLAYASLGGGAMFSDALIESLKRGDTLYQAFEEGRWSANQSNPDQVPWLDGNGNGIPNESPDQNLASQRIFACATNPQPNQGPKISSAEVKTDSTGTMGIWAKVSDNGPLKQVWAVIYPPSYRPPENSESLVSSPLSPFPMVSTSAVDIYSTAYARGFTEKGIYRIVIYAEDKDGLLARPYQVEFTPAKSLLYLPLILK